MNILILKPCSIEINRNIHRAKAGEILMVDSGKAEKIINARFAESCKLTAEDYRKLLDEFAAGDPRGECWSWIQKHDPELWKQHQEAMRGGDLVIARKTFDEMVSAWKNRQNSQPKLMAA